jgi:outer membrane lipoprotein SlyB
MGAGRSELLMAIFGAWNGAVSGDVLVEKLQRVLTPEQWRKFQEERDKIRRTENQNSPKKQL